MVAASSKPSCTCTQCHLHHAIWEQAVFCLYSAHLSSSLQSSQSAAHDHSWRNSTPCQCLERREDLCVRGCITINANRFQTHCCNNKIYEKLVNTWKTSIWLFLQQFSLSLGKETERSRSTLADLPAITNSLHLRSTFTLPSGFTSAK